MSPPIIDTSHFPYVEITYPEDMQADDVAAYETAYMALCARAAGQSAFVAVVDTRAAPPERATISVRRALVGLANAAQKRHPKCVLAEAVVLKGALAHTLYMGYLWLQTDKNVARKAFTDKQQAGAWAKAFLPRDAFPPQKLEAL